MQKTVLIFSGIGALKYVRIGQARALNAAGYNVVLYDLENPNIAPLDLFKRLDEQNLTTVLIGSYQLSRPIMKALLARPYLNIILFCPNYSDWNETLPNEVLKATPNEIKFVEQLKTVMNSLDYCFTYYSKEWLDQTHNKWRELGLEPQSSLLAADIQDYSLGTPNEALASDVAFVGGFWDYKGVNLKKYLYPIALTDINLKIFGYGGWAIAQNIGTIQDQNVRHVYASSKVCPSIYEPLADYGFDISERIYKILSSGGFCVSAPHSGLKFVLGENSYVMADSPEDFLEKVKYYVARPDERIPFIKNGVAEVYSKHTYFHRMRDILELIGDIQGCINLDRIIEQVQTIGV